MLRLFCVTFLLLAHSMFGAEIYPDLRGQRLMDAITSAYRPRRTLSYSAARLKMFMEIDHRDGMVDLIYTGGRFPVKGIPNHQVVNTEHVWPQSRFSDGRGGNSMKTDLHHLFASWSTVNSARGNNGFAEIKDSLTEQWWGGRSMQRYPVDGDINRFSEATEMIFEPREVAKGNIARAMLYFFVIYQDRRIDKAWFKPQVKTLLVWHAADPVDDAERARSIAISKIQGKQNPFILDESLASRIFAP